MKRYLFIIIGIIFIVFIYSCTNSDKVANELIEYHNNDWLTFKKMSDKKLGPMETEFIRLTTGQDLQGTETLIKKEILPTLGELIDYLEGIKLEHKEVKELNQLKVEIQKEIYIGFKELSTMIAEMDRQELEESADILYEYRCLSIKLSHITLFRDYSSIRNHFVFSTALRLLSC